MGESDDHASSLMPYQYGCFISHVHDDGAKMRAFIRDLTEALLSELGPYLEDGRKVALDEDLLAGGVRHGAALAQYMCQSACWVLVYVPKYRRHPWCRREYRAMRELEDKRRAALGSRISATHAMIIPVVLSGDTNDLPTGVPESTFVEDFTTFKLGSPSIAKHSKFQPRVRAMAENIWNVWKACEDLEGHPEDCNRFTLPDDDLGDWGAEQGGPGQGLPR